MTKEEINKFMIGMNRHFPNPQASSPPDRVATVQSEQGRYCQGGALLCMAAGDRNANTPIVFDQTTFDARRFPTLESIADVLQSLNQCLYRLRAYIFAATIIQQNEREEFRAARLTIRRALLWEDK